MESTVTITRTKTIIPRRRKELLTRRRLISQLEDLVDNRLIIIAAPAGYGKTSLLVDFARQSPMPFCWLSLDELDCDPQRFIGHFIASIQAYFPDFGKTCKPALQSMSQAKLNLDALVSLIVNDAYDSITEHFVIVVDDYHFVEENPDINYFINRFLLSVDENAHLVISSRRLLPLPDMPLMVARSMVGGLGFEELAFQKDEIQDFYLQNYKLTISEKEAKTLAESTEGWISGLILSTQVENGRVKMRYKSYPIAGVGLYEYLAQQVMDFLNEEMKRFLYRTSLLEEFDAELCEEVIGKPLGIKENWVRLMDEVQRNNLFVLPVMEQRIWLRYNHLFRDFLRNRMSQEFPEEKGLIQRQLANYYQSIGDWERAYQVYEQIGNFETIAVMIESAGPVMLALGRLLTLKTWLEALPSSILEKSPGLVSIHGATKVMLGDTKGGIDRLDHALSLMGQNGNFSLRAHTLVRRSSAFRMVGDYRHALEDSNKAIELSQDNPDLLMIQASAFHSKGSVLHYLGNLVESLTWLTKAKEAFKSINDEDSSVKASMEIAMVFQFLGKFKISEEIYREALTYYQSTGNIVWQANLLNNLGVLHSLAGDYELALNEFERSIQYAKMGGYIRLEAYALTSLGDLFKDLRAYKEANEAYDLARVAVRQINDQFLKFYLLLVECDYNIQKGHSRKAEEILIDTKTLVQDTGSDYERSLMALEESHLAYLKTDFIKALNHLVPALAYFKQEGHHIEAIRCNLFIFCIYIKLGQLSQADTILDEINKLLESHDLVNVLATGGEPVVALFESDPIPEIFKVKITPLLNVIEQFNKHLPSLRKSLRHQSQVIPLSPPELSIKTFGKIQISLGEHVISGMEWKAQSARDLLLLLLLHPQGMTKEEVGATFWPDSTPAEMRLRFKNLIYRLRHAAGKDVILFEDETYFFNHALDYEADFEQFNREALLAKSSSTSEEQIEHYKNVVEMYNGEFLPEIIDEWAAVERARFHLAYTDALARLVDALMETSSYDDALTYTQLALIDDPTNETMVQAAMRIYASLGNLAAVIKQYELCSTNLEAELGTPPSAQTQNLYNILTRP